jgi:hypothetical protein
MAYLNTFSTTLATFAVATRSPICNQLRDKVSVQDNKDGAGSLQMLGRQRTDARW